MDYSDCSLCTVEFTTIVNFMCAQRIEMLQVNAWEELKCLVHLSGVCVKRDPGEFVWGRCYLEIGICQ